MKTKTSVIVKVLKLSGIENSDLNDFELINMETSFPLEIGDTFEIVTIRKR